MDPSLLAAVGLGFLLGLTHALDADHVAAVGTLVSETAGLPHQEFGCFLLI